MDERIESRWVLASALAIGAVALLLAPAAAVAEREIAAAETDGAAADAGGAAADDVAPDPFAVLEELPPPDYADIETYPGYTADSTADTAADISISSVDAAGPDAAAGAEGDESRYRRAGEVSMDVLVLRPFGALSTVAGCAFMGVAAPFLLPTGDYNDALDTFVADRARYTFERPLGRF